jgi:hypothetical protein
MAEKIFRNNEIYFDHVDHGVVLNYLSTGTTLPFTFTDALHDCNVVEYSQM